MTIPTPPSSSGSSSSSMLLAVHAAIGIAAVAAVVVLCSVGKLDASTTIAVITAVLGLGAGGTLAKL